MTYAELHSTIMKETNQDYATANDTISNFAQAYRTHFKVEMFSMYDAAVLLEHVLTNWLQNPTPEQTFAVDWTEQNIDWHFLVGRS